MSYIETLLENGTVQEFSSKNEHLINEAEEQTNRFRAYLKEFVFNNPEEFVAETLEETYKNMRAFSEVATAQFLAEVSSYYGEQTQQVHAVSEGTINDYL